MKTVKRLRAAVLLLAMTLFLSVGAHAAKVSNSDGSFSWYTTSGALVKSKWIVSKGQRYFASKYGKLYKNCIVKIGTKYYGFGSDCTMQKGKTTINGKTYYFYKSDGHMLRKGFVTIDSKKYYFSSTGVLGKKLWVNNYYINESGYVAKNCWVGSRYVGSDGHPLKGLQTVDGNIYYFNTNTGKKLVSTTKTVNGVKYTFDADGKGSTASETRPVTAGVSVQSTYHTDPLVSDEVLLSAIIYCEAGNQPYYGKVGVGLVITNRMRSSSFPNKLREVVYQTTQFSPTFDGALTRVLNNQSLINDECKQAAKEVMSKYNANTYSIKIEGKSFSLKDYLFFMTNAAYKRLGMKSEFKQIGDHVFFKIWKK